MGRAWFLFLLGFLAPPTEEPQLGMPRVTVLDDTAQISVQFDHAFDAELVERLESGLPTGFVYEFELIRQRKGWWDNEVASSQLEVAAMYNAVSREYLVNFKLDGRLIESRISRSLEDLEDAMTRVESMALFPLAELESGARCRVRARVQLGSRTRFALIPVRIETEWRESSQFRVPDR